MKYELANLLLWLIAIIATILIVEAKFTVLGPFYAICTIGSVIILRQARTPGKK
jgi:hypothetical protein